MKISAMTLGETAIKHASQCREFEHVTITTEGYAFMLACENSVDAYTFQDITGRSHCATVLGNYKASKLRGWKWGTLIGDFYKQLMADVRSVSHIRFDSESIWKESIRFMLADLMNKPECLTGAIVSYNAIWRGINTQTGCQNLYRGKGLSETQFARLLVSVEKATGWKCVDTFDYTGSNLRKQGQAVAFAPIMRTVIFKKVGR